MISRLKREKKIHLKPFDRAVTKRCISDRGPEQGEKQGSLGNDFWQRDRNCVIEVHAHLLPCIFIPVASILLSIILLLLQWNFLQKTFLVFVAHLLRNVVNFRVFKIW